MSRIARQVLVQGRVQGVYYRASTREQARRLGVSGRVRNLTDGRVEAWLEGPDEAVNALIAWMREGPERAEVNGLRVCEVDAHGYPDFEVDA